VALQARNQGRVELPVQVFGKLADNFFTSQRVIPGGLPSFLSIQVFQSSL
jgi:hypothetical protein